MPDTDPLQDQEELLSLETPLVFVDGSDFYKKLSKTMKCEFDAGGNIGKRYRRQDEIGTPYCITIDHDTISPDSENYNTVTVRDRDTMQQERVAIQELINHKK
jgi:glycyl-tRNA synthetase